MHDFLIMSYADLAVGRETHGQPKRAVTKSDKPVLVYFPEPVVQAMDRAATQEDTDRSKWIRAAIREALRRRGIPA